MPNFFQINGIDVSTAEHAKVVELLTGQDRFVRLCVERRSFDPSAPAASSTLDSSGGTGSPDGKSPKIFGLPRPYTGLYSSSSYMANRPSYMRNREPGQYSLSSTSPSADSSSTPTSKISKTSTSSLGRLPGMSGLLSTSPNTDSSSITQPIAASTQNSDSKVKELMAKLPPAPTKLGTTTETVTKKTFTETTVKRVTNNEAKIEDVVLVKAGGPMGLSIIGGSDHICVPFGTGESGIFISKVNRSSIVQKLLFKKSEKSAIFSFFFLKFLFSV